MSHLQPSSALEVKTEFGEFGAVTYVESIHLRHTSAAHVSMISMKLIPAALR